MLWWVGGANWSLGFCSSDFRDGSVILTCLSGFRCTRFLLITSDFLVSLVFSSNTFSAISGVSKVPLMGISVLVQRFRNLCARDVVIPVVGVLCRSSNPSCGFNAVFSVVFNDVFIIFIADSDFPLLWW